MNRPPQESKRISEVQRLRDFAGACFKAAGLREDHAEQLAQLLTNGRPAGSTLPRSPTGPRLLREVCETD